MKKNSLRVFFLIIILIVSNTLSAQVFPVNATVTVTPPYSPYLSDYVSVGSQKVMVSLSLRDLTVPEYACKLRLTIEGVGITIRTKTTFTPQQPFILPGGGSPVLIYGEELGEYFNPANLDFAGITRSEYEKGAKLPEGIYKFTIEALDYYRGTLVSNKGNATLWIILNDPPQLNYPRNESLVQIVNPANIVFNWTPRNTASPNASFTTEYIFRIVEIWPLHGNAYQAFLTQTPLYEVTTTAKQILYTDAEPALLPGRTYAWQVQAVDTEGRDLFKNQGKSEVFVFQFGEALGIPFNLEQDGLRASSIHVKWSAPSSGQMPDQYHVRYRLKGDVSETWYEASVKDQRWTVLNSLRNDTSYFVQVRAEFNNQPGEYCTEVMMKTQSDDNDAYTCGADNFKKNDATVLPLQNLLIGDVITSRNFEVTVVEAKGSGGSYRGTGTMRVPFFSNANISVTFSGSINEKYELSGGEIKSTYTKGSDIDRVITTAHDIGKDNGQQKTNANGSGTPLDITITGVIDSVYVNDAGKIVIVKKDGTDSTFTQPTESKSKALQVVTITDSEGNKVTIGKDGKVQNGGGGEAMDGTAVMDKKYFITLNRESTEYRHGDAINFLRQKGNITLTLQGHAEDKTSKLEWKLDKKSVATGVSTCTVDVSKSGSKQLNVFDDGKKLITINLNVYKAPIILFKKDEATYAGEFGYDGHKHRELLNDAGTYNPEEINDQQLAPAWLTLCSQGTATLKLEAVGLSSAEKLAMENDKDFKIIVKSSSSSLSLNGMGQEVEYLYDEIIKNKPELVITSNVSGKYREDNFVGVYDRNNTLLGKLNVASGTPVEKFVTFVYLRERLDDEWPLLSPYDALHYLNNTSHNQLLVKWSLDPLTGGTDQMEMPAAYDKGDVVETQTGMKSQQQLKRLAEVYKKTPRYKGAPDSYYVFITDRVQHDVLEGKNTTLTGFEIEIPGNFVILYNQRFENLTLTHELGHVLGLYHSFSDKIGPLKIMKGTTENFMDYSPKRNMFFMYQIRKINGH